MEEGQFVTIATEICGSSKSGENNPAKLNRVTREGKNARTGGAFIGSPQQRTAAPAEALNRTLRGEPPKGICQQERLRALSVKWAMQFRKVCVMKLSHFRDSLQCLRASATRCWTSVLATTTNCGRTDILPLAKLFSPPTRR